MRVGTDMIAKEEEVIMGGHQVLCIVGDQVLTMAELAVQFMRGTMAQHMTGAGVLIMVGTEVLSTADFAGLIICFLISFNEKNLFLIIL